MQYTIKDLFNYNNPCIQCGTGTSLKLIVIDNFLMISDIISYNLIPKLKTSIEFPIKYAYNYSLKLIINCENNEYEIKEDYYDNYLINDNSKNGFVNFISENTLMLRVCCNKCQSWSEFSNLKFGPKIIEPISLVAECIYLRNDDGVQFYLSTDLVLDKTEMYYLKNTKAQAFSNLDNLWWVKDGIHISLPAIPRCSFKNKKEMLFSLETYMMLF